MEAKPDKSDTPLLDAMITRRNELAAQRDGLNKKIDELDAMIELEKAVIEQQNKNSS